MTKVKVDQFWIEANLSFTTPLLDWSGVSARFFNMVHKSLSPELRVNPLDFSERTGISPGASEAEYKVFGGTNTIRLSADVLSFRFRQLLASDLEILIKIMEAVDLGFVSEFPECGQASLRCLLSAQVEIIGGESVEDYLTNYHNPKIEEVLFRDHGTTYTPGVRFSANKADKWSLLCSVERSATLPNGLFVSLDVTLPDLNSVKRFESTLKRVSNLIGNCSEATGLEWSREV